MADEYMVSGLVIDKLKKQFICSRCGSVLFEIGPVIEINLFSIEYKCTCGAANTAIDVFAIKAGGK